MEFYKNKYMKCQTSIIKAPKEYKGTEISFQVHKLLELWSSKVLKVLTIGHRNPSDPVFFETITVLLKLYSGRYFCVFIMPGYGKPSELKLNGKNKVLCNRWEC